MCNQSKVSEFNFEIANKKKQSPNHFKKISKGIALQARDDDSRKL